jgi:predicted phosphodiesterase
MKLAIFSDIHGNLCSFESIYRELKKEKCDMHLFRGWQN